MRRISPHLADALLRDVARGRAVLGLGGILDHRGLQPDQTKHAERKNQDGDQAFDQQEAGLSIFHGSILNMGVFVIFMVFVCQQCRGSDAEVTFGSHMRTMPPTPTTILRSRLSSAGSASESTSIWVMLVEPSALGTIPPRLL